MLSYCSPGFLITFPSSSMNSLFFWRTNRWKNLERIRSVVKNSTLPPFSLIVRIFGTKSAATSSGCAANTPKGNFRSSGVESSRRSFVKTIPGERLWTWMSPFVSFFSYPCTPSSNSLTRLAVNCGRPRLVAPYVAYPGVPPPLTPLPTVLKMCPVTPSCSAMISIATFVHNKVPSKFTFTTISTWLIGTSFRARRPPFTPALLIQYPICPILETANFPNLSTLVASLTSHVVW
mmetsp:Transcript_3098/g.4564  ORF Transcript_3098/g.4564 Transcript_3098/m.4564 type:complete len:234 (-) Transcript_3098:437-1138(-)